MDSDALRPPTGRRFSRPLFFAAGLLAGVSLIAGHAAWSYVFQYDAYADAVQGMNGLGTGNPEAAVGAPDATYLSLTGLGTVVTLSFGRGAEGTGDMKMYTGPLAIGAQTRINFLDDDMRSIKEVTLNLTTSLGQPKTYTVAYDAETEGRPYRYVRISSLSALGFTLDAVEATSYLGSTETLDTDGDGITDRIENEDGTDPFNPDQFEDHADPTIEITAPESEEVVSGTVTITADADDDTGISYVQFYVDDMNIGSLDSVAPFEVSWDTTEFGDGPHTITALVEDTSSKQAMSAGVEVEVNN
jgi:hypothetical protein